MLSIFASETATTRSVRPSRLRSANVASVEPPGSNNPRAISGYSLTELDVFTSERKSRASSTGGRLSRTEPCEASIEEDEERSSPKLNGINTDAARAMTTNAAAKPRKRYPIPYAGTFDLLL